MTSIWDRRLQQKALSARPVAALTMGSSSGTNSDLKAIPDEFGQFDPPGSGSITNPDPVRGTSWIRCTEARLLLSCSLFVRRF